GGEAAIKLAHLGSCHAERPAAARELQVIVATSAGEVQVYCEDGSTFPGFPVQAQVQSNATPHLAAPGLPAVPPAPPAMPTAALDGRVYVWDWQGRLRSGFPVRLIDSSEAKPIGTESITTPTLADLDGDGFTDIVVASNEVYSDDFDPAEFQRLMEHLTAPLG